MPNILRLRKRWGALRYHFYSPGFALIPRAYKKSKFHLEQTVGVASSLHLHLYTIHLCTFGALNEMMRRCIVHRTGVHRTYWAFLWCIALMPYGTKQGVQRMGLGGGTLKPHGGTGLPPSFFYSFTKHHHVHCPSCSPLPYGTYQRYTCTVRPRSPAVQRRCISPSASPHRYTENRRVAERRGT